MDKALGIHVSLDVLKAVFTCVNQPVQAMATEFTLVRVFVFVEKVTLLRVHSYTYIPHCHVFLLICRLCFCLWYLVAGAWRPHSASNFKFIARTLDNHKWSC